jgi:hypothetical protein
VLASLLCYKKYQADSHAKFWGDIYSVEVTAFPNLMYNCEEWTSNGTNRREVEMAEVKC